LLLFNQTGDTTKFGHVKYKQMASVVNIETKSPHVYQKTKLATCPLCDSGQRSRHKQMKVPCCIVGPTNTKIISSAKHQQNIHCLSQAGR